MPADGDLGSARRVPARGNVGPAWLCRPAGEEPSWRRSWPTGGGPKEADRENRGVPGYRPWPRSEAEESTERRGGPLKWSAR
jgi:hypothetical protein